MAKVKNPGGTPANLMPAWSATNQPKNKNGRKPSSIKKYIKDNNLNATDISVLAKYILPLNQDQLTALIRDEKIPFVVRIFVKSVLEDFKRGNLSNIMTLIDRAVGKPKETVDVNENSNKTTLNVDYSDMSEDEKRELFFQKIKRD